MENKMESVWVQLVIDGQEKNNQRTKITTDGIRIDDLKDAVKDACKNKLHYCDADELQVFAGSTLPVPAIAQPMDPRKRISDIYKEGDTLIVVAPAYPPGQAPEQVPKELASRALLTLASLEKPALETDLSDYIAVANSCKDKADVQEMWNLILGLQMDKRFPDFPSPFVYILESSGCGKTQLAATAAVLRTDCRVFYFYTGSTSSPTQRFYRPHVALWSFLRRSLNNLRAILLRYDEEGIVGANSILYAYLEHHVFQYFNLLFFGEDKKTTANHLRQKFKRGNHQEKTFVFLDEVPPQGKSFAAMMLRDCLRAIGVVPILMSTHSGPQNAIRTRENSRLPEDAPQLWCRLITKLPENHSFQPFGYAFKSERPLVYHILSKVPEKEKGNLAFCVKEVRNFLKQTNPGAWEESLFQLCQLCRSKTDENSPMSSTHSLVGRHFGHFVLTDREDKVFEDVQRNDVREIGRVRMPVPDMEPMLFLALTAWWEDSVDSNFPLIDKMKAISVRTAYEQHKAQFGSTVASSNPSALKLKGDPLEVIALAATTLASLQSDAGILAGVPIIKFISTVFCLMSPNLSDDSGELSSFTSDRLQRQEQQLASILNPLAGLSDMKVPALPSTDSAFPPGFYPTNISEGASLKRLADSKNRDGCVTKVNPGSKLQDFIHVECKNYKNGIGIEALEKVIKRFRADCKFFFLFTSHVKEIWTQDKGLNEFWTDMEIPMEKVGFLLLSSSEGRPKWLSTLTGEEMKPDYKLWKHVAVVFAIEAVEP